MKNYQSKVRNILTKIKISDILITIISIYHIYIAQNPVHFIFFKRADGWCKSAKNKLEVPVL